MILNEKEIKRILNLLFAKEADNADLIAKFIQELKDIEFEKGDSPFPQWADSTIDSSG